MNNQNIVFSPVSGFDLIEKAWFVKDALKDRAETPNIQELAEFMTNNGLIPNNINDRQGAAKAWIIQLGNKLSIIGFFGTYLGTDEENLPARMTRYRPSDEFQKAINTTALSDILYELKCIFEELEKAYCQKLQR